MIKTSRSALGAALLEGPGAVNASFTALDAVNEAFTAGPAGTHAPPATSITPAPQDRRFGALTPIFERQRPQTAIMAPSHSAKAEPGRSTWAPLPSQAFFDHGHPQTSARQRNLRRQAGRAPTPSSGPGSGWRWTGRRTGKQPAENVSGALHDAD